MTNPQLEQALTRTDEFLAKYPSLFQYETLKVLEEKTGFNKVYFFVLFSLLTGTTIYFIGGAKLVTDLVSFIYPAYASFKAIDSPDQNDDTQWLTYW
eukprot:CAMPEP_0171294984 /NCGR_PEP_ID=MMETSP0816-20121228/3549_1 /TAXON_ID=420281 /ORGANISM="Proboscia inermis, Strain CCAP1064/1" /LENGTH=96 /DNA_ID=CAMNT_0011767287 /DNA_START=44 /DNA_END=331 /DNA_ORIENTATION=+